MICDFIFYSEHFGRDAKIPAEVFSVWERKAEAELLHITGNRQSLDEDTKVKICICEIAEYLYDVSKRQGIDSENNDGYSVSYQNRDIKTDVFNIAKTYLCGTGLLFRGVDYASKF